MANKRQKKKNAKKTYEGQQYRGGRNKKVRNLIKTDSGVVNQHGVAFTYEEKKALEMAVNTANRKRARMLKRAEELPASFGGVPTGGTVGNIASMGRESDFILAKKSKSLQRFQTKEEFNRYLDNVKRVNDRNYVNMRVELYRKNYIQALKDNFGHDADDIIAKIESLSLKEYMERVERDEALEIYYIYEVAVGRGKLSQIRAALEMPLTDEWTDEFIM